MILVTGATGHIGNVLVRKLLERGRSVRALILPGEDTTPIRGLPVELATGDILDAASLGKAMKDVTEVYHLAGMISILPGPNPILHRVNVEGTKNILAAACAARIRRLIYTSSIHAIRRVPAGVPINEEIPFDPDNPVGAYDRSKAEASLAVLQAAQEGLDTVIVCPTGVIGPYDYRRSEMGQLILDCVDQKTQYYVDGAYDFVDVRDVAEGMILAADKGRSKEAYILSGENITVKRLIDSLWDLTGGQFSRIHIPFSLARFASVFTPIYYRMAGTKPRFTRYSLETLRSNSDISHEKASQELGYSPRSLLITIADTAHWFRQNRKLFAIK